MLNTNNQNHHITITLQNVSKKYNRDWIFKNLSYIFQQTKSYAIVGSNGSGKSTLLQVIAASTNATNGKIIYQNDQAIIENENIHQYLTIAAPYLELIEEMTVKEFLQFHANFKSLSLPIDKIISIVDLQKAINKQIRYYSSGMKQRVKLAQAIFSNVPIILLDEPCTNLDKTGYQLYHHLIHNYCANKLVIVSSNDENEMDFCEERINIMEFR